VQGQKTAKPSDGYFPTTLVERMVHSDIIDEIRNLPTEGAHPQGQGIRGIVGLQSSVFKLWDTCVSVVLDMDENNSYLSCCKTQLEYLIPIHLPITRELLIVVKYKHDKCVS
jgi:hypothetical protein